ncbi:MAG: tyrosine--tRNA ligase, partial [Gemmatimonadetes bacterium]|nr:tyrosine--tRNA ligase [Gemmatimonadota bacterium]NNK64289.1 tyrosine--tRNA ligase [Gemmatimonadota bacterium]
IMVLVHAQRAGHHPIALVGGATGLIGDPSGKKSERPLLTRADMEANALGIRRQLEHFLDFETDRNPARMRNNLDWLGQTHLLDFLRDIGKHFSVNAMLRKESVRRRVESEESGISFTEFSYQLLQAADFLHLFESDGCSVQMGGSDQWGNITAGVELVRRVAGGAAHGVVSPLVTTSTGTKFGKTEDGTVWLDPERTSPYRFYQFWINVPDDDVGRYLRFFTLLDRDEIEALDAATAAEPHRRAAQKALAEDVTRRVHGAEGLERAVQATRALFGGDLEGLSGDEIGDIFSDVPSSSIGSDELDAGMGLLALLADTGLCSSRGDARRQVDGGGIYLNSVRIEDSGREIRRGDFIDGRFLVLRKGKKSYHLVEFAGDA